MWLVITDRGIGEVRYIERRRFVGETPFGLGLPLAADLLPFFLFFNEPFLKPFSQYLLRNAHCHVAGERGDKLEGEPLVEHSDCFGIAGEELPKPGIGAEGLMRL